MLEDYSVQTPTAIWNTVRGVWETTQKNLLCEHWELFSEVWPTSGMMRNGVVYAQQMQAHRMEGIEFSSRLGPRAIPTPTVADSSWGGGATRTVTKSQPYRGLGLTTWAERAAEGNLDIELLRTPGVVDSTGGAKNADIAKDSGNHLKLQDQMVTLAANNGLKVAPSILLATPTTQPSKCRNHGGDLLHDVTCGCPRAERKLPTPTTRDYKDGAIAPAKHRPNDTDTLVRAMASVKEGSVWGQYEPAIRRWEAITGREAPSPTLPDGREGQQRLSPLLTEWMMGLPEGWITSPDIGISRNDQIKAAGNGVVPQQAVLALRYLLRKGNNGQNDNG